MKDWVAVRFLDDLSEDEPLPSLGLFIERAQAALAELPENQRQSARLRVIQGDARDYYEVGYFKRP